MNDEERKKQKNEYFKKYYQKNREKILKQHREYYKNNKNPELRKKYYDKEAKEFKDKYDRLNVIIPKEDGKKFRKILQLNNDTITNWTTTRIKKYIKANNDKLKAIKVEEEKM